jgi:hypothetical protein
MSLSDQCAQEMKPVNSSHSQCYQLSCLTSSSGTSFIPILAIPTLASILSVAESWVPTLWNFCNGVCPFVQMAIQPLRLMSQWLARCTTILPFGVLVCAGKWCHTAPKIMFHFASSWVPMIGVNGDTGLVVQTDWEATVQFYSVHKEVGAFIWFVARWACLFSKPMYSYWVSVKL